MKRGIFNVGGVLVLNKPLPVLHVEADLALPHSRHRRLEPGPNSGPLLSSTTGRHCSSAGRHCSTAGRSRCQAVVFSLQPLECLPA